jgi:hypothetical protein
VTTKRIIAVLIAVAAAILVAFALLRTPEPLREADLDEVSARFMKILPGDLPQEQKLEIEGLLKRFQSKSRAEQIRPEDYQEVMQLMTEYLTKGSITKEELHIVMAKVGYYSYRGLSADSTAVHPLLTPVEAPTDSVRRDHSHE